MTQFSQVKSANVRRRLKKLGYSDDMKDYEFEQEQKKPKLIEKWWRPRK